jgi:phosphoribosylamine-glycine ligase
MGMPAVFAKPYSSRSQHISSQKIAQFVQPLIPWLKKTGYRGVLQVGAVKNGGKFYLIEYNVRIGVTTPALFLRMLKNPVQLLTAAARGEKLNPRWHEKKKWGCTVILAGYGFPYMTPKTPGLPVSLKAPLTCDLWWNEVDMKNDRLYTTPHEKLSIGPRIADVAAVAESRASAVTSVYQNITKIQCSYSYYRTDMGEI